MSNIKVLARNRKARHEYHIEDTYEAGIELKGTEVKSCRMGKVSLQDAYVQITNGEAFIHSMHISPYDKGDIQDQDPRRTRKLLLHKREIMRLHGLTTQKGYTIIPLQMYLKRGLVKLEIAIARGKQLHDKRRDLKERAIKREIERDYI